MPLWHNWTMLNDFDKIKQLSCWNGNVTIEPLKGGLSNANYLVEDADGKHVVRFGQDYPFHHVSRQHEVMVAKAAHAAGFAPKIEWAETGVMVSQYLDAKTYSAMDVKVNPRRIAKLLFAFHTVMPKFVSGPSIIFWPFHMIRDYVRTLKTAGQTGFAGELQQAEAFESAQQAMPIIFGHHDLLPANFLDDGNKLWLIDFEYAGFGTAMFDLAGTAANGHMHPDEKAIMLETYFGQKPDSKAHQAFAAMECAALLRETLWARVSSLFLAAPGVDYNVYAVENRERYQASLEAYQNQYGKITA
jgi:thiamine kinase-like enzyme